MRVERSLVFRIAIGRVVIGVLSAEVLAAVTRRYRVLRQAHADVLGQFLGTVIHHGRSQRCTLAQPEVAIALAVILEPFRRLLVRARAARFCAVLAGARQLSSQYTWPRKHARHSANTPTQKPHLSRRSSVSSIGWGRDDDKLAQDAEPEHRVLKPASIG
jgi:hypothetical protein